MTKQDIRTYYRERRTEITNKEIKKFSEKIYQNWLLTDLCRYDSYHIFLTIEKKKEIETSPIIQYLWNNNKTVYCSRVEKDTLVHFKLTPETVLEENSWGIPEPIGQNIINIEHIDCIFVPLLGYDMKGNRVGYGKGFYDRFLSQYPESVKIGLSLFIPIDKITDIKPQDVSLDYIITPLYSSGFPIEEK